MPKRRVVDVGRGNPKGIEPVSRGRKSGARGVEIRWVNSMGAHFGGATEVMVKISGGGRSASGIQAHFEDLDRHGREEIETDAGTILKGEDAAAQLINEWGLDLPTSAYGAHSRQKASQRKGSSKATPTSQEGPRQAFNIVLSMPKGTEPKKVLEGARRFAREEFAFQHRYAMVLHTDQAHPHVHLVVKAEHEHGGKRLNPRKDTLRAWRERFAVEMRTLGVAATATAKVDRGLASTHKKTSVYRSVEGDVATKEKRDLRPLFTKEGDSTFMRKKLDSVRREIAKSGRLDDRVAQGKLTVSRGVVLQRYNEAIAFLKSQGRMQAAQRFESARDRLPPVRTEKQLVVAAWVAERRAALQRSSSIDRSPSREFEKVRTDPERSR